MLSSHLNSMPNRRYSKHSAISSPFTYRTSSIAARESLVERQRLLPADPPAYRDEAVVEEDEEGDEEEEEDDVDEDEDGQDASGLTPLLPIFEAAQLDTLPVYTLTHSIRLLVVPRCETTLTWDQLRSPQVSQFLVKPIQQQILESHFNKATLYALIANCLQFNKEAELYPANSGTSRTRALVCELLAIKLLKEFNIRELIDALSYDFYPLQGLTRADLGTNPSSPNWDLLRPQPSAARISTLEVAIKAQTKRFLAHPVVIQHLEAIWAGAIVFHSAADNLHRVPSRVTYRPSGRYGTMNSPAESLSCYEASKHRDFDPLGLLDRRSVTLYDPGEASLFKLSRLRVPRYRQFLSTCSFAALLWLFVAVLAQRSLHITPLEVVFWFWSAGFMLDEIVTFTEQGFGLYIMSLWNMFDLGILMLFACYYGMRLYGILMPDLRKRQTADLAYDFLGANAVLLFPRLFSFLDHYRYFSPLLIAFRMMAADLIAILILICVSLSGFFVTFSLGFGNDQFNLKNVTYFCFQMVMGFTPAVWERWITVNFIGKGIMVMFLFVCHFLIITILITVLTNSFMKIVQNANDEHQFVFAVNTISMVKSDALFSYVAPTNLFAWILSPLRYVMSFRHFVLLNRIVIKITHFPVLLVIYLYERVSLRSSAFVPTELIESRGRNIAGKEFGTEGAGLTMFQSRQSQVKEPSVATYYKDQALDEVFRRPFRDNSARRPIKSLKRTTTHNVVNSWMQSMGSDVTDSPPADPTRTSVGGQESRRSTGRRSVARRQTSSRNFTINTMSIASDPEIAGPERLKRPVVRRNTSDLYDMSMEDVPEQTDADGDDELVTNDEMSPNPLTSANTRLNTGKETQPDYFQHVPVREERQPGPQSISSGGKRPPGSRQHEPHGRQYSTNTVVYNPTAKIFGSPTAKNSTKSTTAPGTGSQTPISVIKKAMKRVPISSNRSRPVMPARSLVHSTPNIATMMALDPTRSVISRNISALDIASDLGDNKAVGGGLLGAIPASFSTQRGFALRMLQAQQEGAAEEKEDQRMMNKLVLARMNTFEEGLREVLTVLKDKDGNKSTGDEKDSKANKKVRKVKKSVKGKEILDKTREEGWVDDDVNTKGEGASRSSV